MLFQKWRMDKKMAKNWEMGLYWGLCVATMSLGGTNGLDCGVQGSNGLGFRGLGVQRF